MQPYLLQQLLMDSALRHPRRPAVIQGECMLTYAELEAQSSRLAASLAKLGVKPGDRVGILMNKSIEAVTAIYGILKAGGIYVPLDHLSPMARLAGILERCNISVLVASPVLAGKLLAEPLAVHLLQGLVLAPGEKGDISGLACVPWEEVEAVEAAAPDIGPMADTRPAYILHTSGSTGIPKGVVISHLNALTFVRMAVDFFGISSEDRLASHAPFHFDLSVFDLFTAASVGAAVVLVPEMLAIFPPRLAEFIDRAEITIWNSVAPAIALLAEHGRLDRFTFEALRLVIFSEL